MDAKDEGGTIRIRIGGVGAKFVEHWQTSATDAERAGLEVSFLAGSAPKGGLALAVPPEIVLAFGKGVAAAIGTGVGKLAWTRLRAFFRQNPSMAPKQGVVITPCGEIPFDPANMPEQPPQPSADGPK